MHTYVFPHDESTQIYWVFRAQADCTFILLSELPTKELHHLPRKMTPQAYQTSQYVVPRSGVFLGKWCSTFAGNSDSKMNVQSACALNTLYIHSFQMRPLQFCTFIGFGVCFTADASLLLKETQSREILNSNCRESITLINLMANSAKSIHSVRQTLIRSCGDGI
jgi:hypothetical protein